MTKTRKIALAMFSAFLAISLFVSALFGFGVIGNFANAESVTITMKDGAALRLSAQPALGFYATLDSNNDAFDYGMIIVDSKDVERNNITSNYHANFASKEIEFEDLACIPYVDKGEIIIRAALEDITEAYYYTRYMGIAYAKDANGAYTYADANIGENSRSVIDLAVANYGLNDGEYTEESKENLANFYSNVLGKTELFAYSEEGQKFNASIWDSNVSAAKFATITATADQSFQTTQSFSGVTAVQFDFRLDDVTGTNWFGFTFGTSNYASPVLIRTSQLAGNKATLSAGLNNLSIAGKWMTIRYEVTSNTTANIYFVSQGTALGTPITATIDEASQLLSGNLRFCHSSAMTVSIDNIIIETSAGNTTISCDDETGLTKKANGASIAFNSLPGVFNTKGEVQITSYSDTVSAVVAQSFDGITGFQYDIRIEQASSWFGFTMSSDTYATPLLIQKTGISGNGPALSKGISYSDITGKWLTLKIAIVDATTFTISYAIDGGAMSDPVTATGYDTTKISSGNLGFCQANTFTYSLRNVAISTADGTYYCPMSEDTFVKNNEKATLTYSSMGMMTSNASNNTVYTAATELTAPRITLSESVSGTMTSANTPSIKMEIEYVASGNAAFGIGFASNRFLSVQHVNGTNVLKYNNNGTYSNVANLPDASNKLLLTLDSTKTLKVSINGAAAQTVAILSIDTIVPTYVDLTAGGKVEINSFSCTSFNKAFIYDSVDSFEETITIKTGSSYQMVPDVIGEGTLSDLAYFVDNKNVATANKSGVITGENPGETYLRVRIGREEKVVKIIVQDELTENLVTETFKAIRISGSKFDVQGDNIESNTAKSAMIKMSGGFDHAGEDNGYLISRNIYDGISSVEFKLYVPTWGNWWGINFIDLTQSGAKLSGYVTPVTISKTGVASNGTTLTAVNSVSFDLTKDFVTFRLDMASSSEAALYINGVHAYNISGYTGGSKNFTRAKILISSAGLNQAYVDDIKVAHTGEYVLSTGDVYVLENTHAAQTDVEDFSRGYSHFTIGGGSASLVVENGIYVGEKEYAATGKFYNFGAGAIPSGNDYTTTYMQALSTYNMSEFSFDVKVTDSTSAGDYTGFSVLLGTSIYYPIIRIGTKGFCLNSDVFASYAIADGASYSGQNIKVDNTEWTTYKFVKESALDVGIYAGAKDGSLTKLVTITLNNDKLKHCDMSLAKNASAKLMFTRTLNTSATYGVAFDNLSITTASGTVTETFSNMVYADNTQTFDLVKVVGVKDTFSSQYTLASPAVLYNDFSSLGRINVKKSYVTEGGEGILALSLNAKLSLSDGKQIAILLGDNNVTKVLSTILVANGNVKVVSIGQDKVTEQSTVLVDTSDLRIKVYADGKVTVYNGTEYVDLGSLNSINGKISFVDYNGVGSAVLGGLTINGAVDYIVDADEVYKNNRITISAYSVLPETDSINWLDWSDEELRAYLTLLRDAGFTTGMALQDGNFAAGSDAEKAQILDRYILGVLDMCEELGLDYLVKDWILMNLLGNSKDIASTVKDLFTNIEYIYHEAYRGNVGTDEPGTIKMARLKEMFDAFKQNVPHGEFNMNMLPDYAQSWQYEDNNVDNKNSSTNLTHQEYINAYIDTVGRDAGHISIDYYPFHKKGAFKTLALRETYLTCLQRVANAAVANNIENRQYVQIDSADSGWNCSLLGEVSLQVYTHLAFGTTNLTYYVYAANCFTDGQPNSVYDFVKTTNSYVKAFEKALLQYEWKGVYFTEGSKYDSGVTSPTSLPIAQTPMSSASSTVDTLYGIFEKDSGGQAILAVNISLPTKKYSDTVNITFKKATKAIVYKNGVKSIEEFNSGSYSFTLAAGEGMFIIPLA